MSKKNAFRLPFKSEDQILSAINKLPKDHQGIIARIVWWDWYAGRLVADRTDSFDHWLNERWNENEPPENELSLSMQKMGYSKQVSDRRCEQKYVKKQIKITAKEQL